MRALDSRLFVLSAEIDRELDDYRASVPAIRSAESIAFRRPVTMFIGENGSGKSTLIEAIAIAAIQSRGRIEELPVRNGAEGSRARSSGAPRTRSAASF